MTTQTTRLIAILWLAGAVVFSGCALAGLPAGGSLPKTGTVSGTVTEANGRGAAGLDVSIGSDHHATSTDESGFFKVSGVRPGVHTVTVSRDGETLRRKTGVKVESRRTAHLDFQVAATPFLRKHLSLIVLVAAGVLCIIASVAIKTAMNRAREARGEAVEQTAVSRQLTTADLHKRRQS